METSSRTEIFVNLKRFDVPVSRGGICPEQRPADWIRSVMRRSVELGLGRDPKGALTYLLPESLLLVALEELEEVPKDDRRYLSVGCQGVFREDVVSGGNFGAFTTNLPASAAAAAGATWSIIGHSEERKDKLGLLSAYDPEIEGNPAHRSQARLVVDEIVNAETARALGVGLNVLFCVGETEEDRGSGSFDEQKPRITGALRTQIAKGLAGVSGAPGSSRVVIGYEPIWAIGPGKTPPDAAYIDFVARFVKDACLEEHGFEPPVVYGGGLKEANAGDLGSLSSLSGGLVALTKFTPPIGFSPDELSVIVKQFQAARPSS
jgi:triosephosphate isomerase (TIM)